MGSHFKRATYKTQWDVEKSHWIKDDNTTIMILKTYVLIKSGRCTLFDLLATALETCKIFWIKRVMQ